MHRPVELEITIPRFEPLVFIRNFFRDPVKSNRYQIAFSIFRKQGYTIFAFRIRKARFRMKKIMCVYGSEIYIYVYMYIRIFKYTL